MLDVDWPAVREIYEHGIATGNATFETGTPDWDDWDAGHLYDHRLVADGRDGVVGWAALSPVSSRCAYRGVASDSLYVRADTRGLGVGRALLEALITGAEAAGIWTIETGIFPDNRVSVHLHQQCGFRIVGTRERIGQLNGTWRDVYLLERRSPVVGVGSWCV
jgi:phosphinothricin acetyltransferase